MSKANADKSPQSSSQAVAQLNTSGSGVSRPAANVLQQKEANGYVVVDPGPERDNVQPFRLTQAASSPESGSFSGGIVQRTVTQILPGAENKISRLNIVGRPERVFGNSMGDHTTAFATHIEAIKLQMEGKTLSEALTGLVKLYGAAKALPGYELKDNLPADTMIHFGNSGPHGNRLRNAEIELDSSLRSALALADGDQTAFALKLQECVNAYLEFRELIPLSAINVMSVAPALAGKGKGEAGHAGVLAQHEKGQIPTHQPQLQLAIMGALDLHAVAMVVAATDDATLSKLAPGVNTGIPAKKRIVLFAAHHLKAIESEFPKSYAAAGLTQEDVWKAVIPLAQEEMKKNRLLLVGRLKSRMETLQGVIDGILSGINSTKYYRDYRDALVIETEGLKKQITAINEVLEDAASFDIKAVPVVSERGEAEKKEAETKEAEKREEEVKTEEERRQPIATQIVLKNEGGMGYRISQIQIAGRPPSPIPGSMGAHTTAWVVHTDRIRRALAGLPITEALNIMNNTLVDEAKELAKTLATANPPVATGQEALAANALLVLEARKSKAVGSYTSASEQAFVLQQYINELFTYINYIPGVTRAAVNTDGRGEGTHRNVLIDLQATIRSRADQQRKKKGGKKITVYNIKLSRDEYLAATAAIDGLLDVAGLGSRAVYERAHAETISKAYPLAWHAVQKFRNPLVG